MSSNQQKNNKYVAKDIITDCIYFISDDFDDIVNKSKELIKSPEVGIVIYAQIWSDIMRKYDLKIVKVLNYLNIKENIDR